MIVLILNYENFKTIFLILVWKNLSERGEAKHRGLKVLSIMICLFFQLQPFPPPPLPSVLDKNHASKILILWEMHSKNIWYPYYLPLLSPMFSFFDFLFKVDKPGLMAWLFLWLGFVIFKDIGPPPPNPLKSVQNSKLHYHYHKKVRIGGWPISGSHTSACATILACVILVRALVYCNFHKGG